MIDISRDQFDVMVDIGRPCITDAKSRDFISDIHAFIKEDPLPIRINDSFAFIESILATPDRQYIGAGYKYCFWFANEEDKHTFVHTINEIGLKHYQRIFLEE